MRITAAPRLTGNWVLAIIVAALLLAACGSDDSEPTVAPVATATPDATATPEPTASPTPAAATAELAINHIQVLGSHNSYHLRPETALFDALVGVSAPLAESIEYSHLPLTEQLDTYGIRQLEIDVYADPDGGLYANPAANPLVGLEPLGDPALAEPGFKVLHTQDFDYGTTCVTLVVCLEEIDAWSVAHPTHLPVMVMLEFKSESVPEAAADEGIELTVQLPWTTPLDPTAELLEALDTEIRSIFSDDRLILPDDVRAGAPTLEAAILDDGWPSLDDSRGKLMFTMTDGGAIRDLYVTGSPNLEGRPIFTNGTPGQPDAAFLRIDDPLDPNLAAAIEAGYLVRTRTDVPTSDARTNNTTRRDAALESGAHFLSTDYYTVSEFFDSTYEVALPGDGVARCNPISAPTSCTDDMLAE